MRREPSRPARLGGGHDRTGSDAKREIRLGSRKASAEPSAWTEPRQDRFYRQYNKQPMRDRSGQDTIRGLNNAPYGSSTAEIRYLCTSAERIGGTSSSGPPESRNR